MLALFIYPQCKVSAAHFIQAFKNDFNSNLPIESMEAKRQIKVPPIKYMLKCLLNGVWMN